MSLRGVLQHDEAISSALEITVPFRFATLAPACKCRCDLDVTMTIRCEIVSQDRTVFQGDVDIVVLPGAAGEMGILPHHAPVLTILKDGVIKVRRDGREDLFTVAGGMAEVQPDIVTVLADAAENIEEIDIIRAKAAKKRAEDALANLKP